jgi:hypothetical protein
MRQGWASQGFAWRRCMSPPDTRHSAGCGPDGRPNHAPARWRCGLSRQSRCRGRALFHRDDSRERQSLEANVSAARGPAGCRCFVLVSRRAVRRFFTPLHRRRTLAAELVDQLRRPDAHPVVTHPRELRMTVELRRESERVDALERLGHAKRHCRDGRSARRLSGSGFEVSPERDDARIWARPGPPGMAARSPATTSTSPARRGLGTSRRLRE